MCMLSTVLSWSRSADKTFRSESRSDCFSSPNRKRWRSQHRWVYKIQCKEAPEHKQNENHIQAVKTPAINPPIRLCKELLRPVSQRWWKNTLRSLWSWPQSLQNNKVHQGQRGPDQHQEGSQRILLSNQRPVPKSNMQLQVLSSRDMDGIHQRLQQMANHRQGFNNTRYGQSLRRHQLRRGRSGKQRW